MDLIDIIKKIKITRMRPEELFILGIFDRVKRYDINNFIKYKIDNELIFSFDERNGSLWVDFHVVNKIWFYIDIKKNSLSDFIIKYFNEYLYDGQVYIFNHGSPRNNVKYL